MPEGDTDRHPGASGVFPSWRPGHNGIRGMVQQGAEQYGGIAGMQLSHGFGAGVLGGMRPVGPLRATARQQPASPRELGRHLGHVGQYGIGRGTGADAGIDQFGHVKTSRIHDFVRVEA